MIRLVRFYTSVIFNKSHEKTKTDNVLVNTFQLPNPTDAFRVSLFQLQRYININFISYIIYSNRSKQCICCTTIFKSRFGAQL